MYELLLPLLLLLLQIRTKKVAKIGTDQAR